MFHRVKLENQDEQDNKEEQEVAAVAVEETVKEAAVEEQDADKQTTSVEEEITVQEPEQKQAERAYEIPAKTYQRSNQPASSAGYPGSSYGASYKTAPVEEVAVEEPVTTALADDGGDDRTLIIGRGITMSGEIEACDQLVVQGTVEASLKGARSLEVSESGTFYGTVEIENAVISGRFEGEISVNGRLVITETGVITGTVSYRELQVESGAILDGRITPLRAQVAPQAVEPASKSSQKTAAALAKAKEVKAQKDTQPAPANTDGGLFEEKAVVAE